MIFLELQDEEEISLQEYILILRKRKRTIFTVIITALLAVLIVNFFTPPVYKATTTILLSKSVAPEAIFGGAEGNILFGKADEIETQIEILKSYSIAEGVAKRLPASILGVNNPNHNNETELTFKNTINQIRGSMTVNSLKNTNIIEINFENNNPKLAAEIANTIAAVFVDESLTINRSRATEVKKFIEEQLKEKEAELTKEEEEKLEYKKQESILFLDEETKINITQLANFQAQAAEVDTQIVENKAELIEAHKQLKKQSETYVSSETITTNPIVQELQSQLATLEIQLPALLEKYNKGSPQITEVEIKIKETKNKISEKVAEIVGAKVTTRNPIYQSLLAQIVTLETDTISLDTKKEAIAKTIIEYENRLEKLPDKELQLARLERAVKVSENIYLILLEKYQEARINEVMELGDIRIIDKALVPDAPIKPKKKLNLAIGGVLGVMLGVMLVFFMEYLDNTIKTADDIERHLGLPVLGLIPKVNSKRKKR